MRAPHPSGRERRSADSELGAWLEEHAPHARAAELAALGSGSRDRVSWVCSRVLPVSILDLAPIVEGGTPAEALGNSIDLVRRRAPRVHALLGRGVPQPERDRERGDVGRDRALGRRDRVDPGRGGRHHAAEPRAARDRGAVRDAGGAASRSDRSRSWARARHRSGHAARSAAGSERRLVPTRRPGAPGAARRSAPRTDGVRDSRRRVACAALDPRVEPLRSAARRGARPPVRVRLALRARSAAPGARGVPRALPILRATRGAIRDGRRERRRSGRRHDGQAVVHVRAAGVHECDPRQRGRLPPPSRTSTSIGLPPRRPTSEHAEPLVRRIAGRRARRPRMGRRRDHGGRADRRRRDPRPFGAVHSYEILAEVRQALDSRRPA